MCILRDMRKRLGLLFVMYMVQGLPFGFQATSLPVFLRESGQSLTVITLTWLLAAPWMLKALWSPWVERERGSSLGRRRSWILPMQLCLACACLAAAFVEPSENLPGLLLLVLIMNVCTATMDIAVDGLTVEILDTRYLGYGNIAQVVGYKVGIVISGGLFLWLSDRLTWFSMFSIMAAIVVFGMLLTLLYQEPRSNARELVLSTASSVWAVARQVLFTTSARIILILIASYKLGESIGDALFKLYLFDHGISKADIGLWVGTYGIGASIVGSIVGGLIASRMSFMRAVLLTASLQIIPVTGQLLLVIGTPSEASIIAVTIAENFFGGALTTAMFTFMMSRVDRRIGGMHYTVLATVEVLGKGAIVVASGPIAQATSYAFMFTLAVGLTIGFVALLTYMNKLLTNDSAASRPDDQSDDESGDQPTEATS